MEKSINPLNGFHSLIFRLQNSPSVHPSVDGRINENQRDFPPRHNPERSLTVSIIVFIEAVLSLLPCMCEKVTVKVTYVQFMLQPKPL